MATVYRGRKTAHGGFERDFAVKVIHPHLSAVDGFTERFLDEARVASRVHHPNVCAVIDVEKDRGYQFLILELIDGVTLRQAQVWGDGAPLDPEEAARIVADTAHGLEALHTVTDEHGDPLDVVHRDVSPHNLMIDGGGRTVLIDLGLAEARDKLGHTQTGVLCGKLPYMSPEQSLLEQLDHRSDIFSLGTVLFELVTGELPFGEDHTPDTLDRLRRADVEELAVRLEAHGVPTWLRQIIGRCLQLRPHDRFARADELAEALEAEMHLRGFQQSDIRSRISVRVRQTQAAIGVEEPVAPLPDPIAVGNELRPTHGHHEVGQAEPAPGLTGPISAALRGLAIGAVAFVAVLAITGLATRAWIHAFSDESRQGAGEEPNLGALDRADGAPASAPAPAARRSQTRAGAKHREAVEPGNDLDTGGKKGPDPTSTPVPAESLEIGKPPPRPRRRAGSRSRERGSDAPTLKRNPYTE